jgi:hypothetical protein
MFVFFLQDIGGLWNRRRNDGRYAGVPPTERSILHPTPWPKELIQEFRVSIEGHVVIPPTCKGTVLIRNVNMKNPMHL